MGRIRHGRATTTQAVRAAIQRSEASIAVLSWEHGGNPKTLRSTVLSPEDEAVIVAFRRSTPPPLDDPPVRLTADDRASDTIVIASLSAPVTALSVD